MVEANSQPREKPLYRIFTAVPPRYDLVNRIFTLGMDEGWRKRTARYCLATHPSKVLDLCCGTGDLAIWLARLAAPETQVFGLDYSEPMLAVARAKAAKKQLPKQITFIHGDVSALPFPAADFDVIGISFAFRNLTFKNALTTKYLSEVVRVLKPGGRFVIVESSQPPNRVIRALHHFYLRAFVKRVGVIVSGNKPAYNYLAESAAKFYDAEEMGELLKKAGFRQATYKRLFFGACAIHIATK